MTGAAADWAQHHGVPRQAAETMATALEALEHPPGVADLLAGLLARMRDAGVTPEALAAPHAAEALVRLAYAAPFLVRHLSARPEALDAGVLAGLDAGAAGGGDDAMPGWRAYAAPEETPGLDEAGVMRRLRLWKYDAYTRITARDLLGLQGARETCAQIAALAEGMVRVAYAWSFSQAVARHGLPLRAGGALAPGAVVGMGKLGGGELNYASDIDLIFVQDGDDTPCRHPADAPAPPVDPAGDEGAWWAQWEALAPAAADGAEGRGTSVEFHNRQARQVIRVLGHAAPEGIGFRVDVDLRPQGRTGLLAPNMGYLEAYYLQHGREWERAAMLKARVVAGHAGVGERFAELIRPFVYRRYLDFSALEGVAIVKHDIDRVHRATLESNIKLGRGGIRESEFLVQALQLLYGGKRPELQVPGHQAAVERLVGAGILSAADGERMQADYWTLRATENRIQMPEEAQTHNLPDAEAERRRVFHDFRPGFGARLPEAEAALEAARRRTAERFAELFAGMGEGEFPDPEQWREAVRERLPAEVQEGTLGRIDGLFARLMRSRMGERCVFKLARLLARPELYREGTDPAFPRWVEFLEQIGNRNAIYALIDAHPPIVPWVSHIFAEGGRHAQVLMRHPEFLESFFSIAEQWESCEARFAEVLETSRDDEEFILELQTARAQMLIRILTTYLNQPEEAYGGHHAQLSDMADATVNACTRWAWRRTAERLGVPEGAGPEAPTGFAVLALGKLGSRELHFDSDLDLVFVYGGEGTTTKDRSHYEFFTKLAQRIGTLLTSQTMFGRLYELDHRLRPFGNKGVLVPSLSAYESFLAGDAAGGGAEVWNFQAFTRIRPVCGDAALADALVARIAGAWQRRAPPRAEIVAQVRDMLGRLVREHAPRGPDDARVLPLKYAVGGLMGCEFAAQAHFLCERAGGPADWTPPPEHAIIAALRPDYRELSALDERLGFHLEQHRHEARPEHFRRLAAIGARWQFDAVEALCKRMEARVEEAFRALAG